MLERSGCNDLPQSHVIECYSAALAMKTLVTITGAPAACLVNASWP